MSDTSDKKTNELFDKIASLADYFVEGYEAKPEEKIGIALAHYFKWDSRIIDTCINALEDANFHTEAEGLMESHDESIKASKRISRTFKADKTIDPI